MEVQHIYQLALLVLVVPSILLNRVAGAVLGAWAFGQLMHWLVPSMEDALDMFAYIVAFGGGLALAGQWESNWRSHGRWIAVLLFMPLALSAATSALVDSARSYAEYQISTSIYWAWAGLLFMQVLCVLIGNDWKKVWRGLLKIDGWIVSRVERHFENLT